MDLLSLLLACILFGLIGAAIGGTRGRAGAGFFWGLLLGPLGWIIILVGPNYKAEAKQKEQQAKAAGVDSVAALAQLASLREKGVLTEDEFQAKKKELLATN